MKNRAENIMAVTKENVYTAPIELIQYRQIRPQPSVPLVLRDRICYL